MSVAQVVIVGQPNVGKSSLFNWITGKRLAITDAEAGVTRDRLEHLMHYEGRYFDLVDTGGLGLVDEQNMHIQVERQIESALDNACLILFVVDTRSGLTPLDRQIMERLNKLDVPIVCVANKTDDPHFDSQADEFYALGIKELVKISVHQNRGKEHLLNVIKPFLPAPGAEQLELPEEPVMKVAIVGRQNVGKSTFINALAQAERVIVSEVAGTTRDSIDVRFEMDDKTFIAIDTPGLRRGKSIHTNIDYYGAHRAKRSVRRADVVLLFFDPQQRISRVDKQLCSYIDEEYKPCVFVVNKWDLFTKNMPTGKWVRYLRDAFPAMQHVPIAFITAQTGKNVKALLNHSRMLHKQALARTSTADLNRIVRAALQHNPPPLYKTTRPKIYFATQVGVQPPTLVLFCNNPAAFHETYLRYLVNFLRDQLKYSEIPIKIYLRKRQSQEEAYAPDDVGFELDEQASER